jgi:hypothetical protein
MRNTFDKLIGTVALLVVACPAFADVFSMTATTTLTNNAPQSIYEVNPGQSASVTFTVTAQYVVTNISTTTRIGYFAKYKAVHLNIKANNANQFQDVTQPTQIKSIMAGVTWTPPSETFTSTGSIPINEYVFYGSSLIFEDKTGEASDTDVKQRDVTVRPYA